MRITPYRYWAVSLIWIVAAGICAGAAWGVIRGWNELLHGFSFAVFGHVADRAVPGILYALTLLPVLLAHHFLLRSLGGFRAALTAAGFVYLPLFAFCGYTINRIYLPGFLEPQSVFWNILLSIGILALWLAIAVAVSRWRTLVAWSAFRPGVLAAPGLFLVALHAGTYFHGSSRFHARPGVLILLIDALRADHLSCYGYARETTPNIDRFARDSVVFTQAISQSTFTKTSIASLFTSLYPFEHGVYVGNQQDSAGNVTSDVLPETAETLADALLRDGFLTAAWVQNAHLRPHFGFARGFVRYETGIGIETTNEAFLNWLRAAGRHHQYAAYLHYLDLHDPYRPNAPYEQMYGGSSDVYRDIDMDHWGAYLAGMRRGQTVLAQEDVENMKALYDGQLKYIDTQVGELFQELRDSGLYDNLMIILTADHGDGFMEHGFISHSTTPYDELIRVPLIIKFPESRHRGKRVSDQVQLIDVMPTVLKELGQETNPNLSGVALQSYLRKKEGITHPPQDRTSRLAYSEAADPYTAETITAIRSPAWKYLHFDGQQEREELYNLEADPREQANVIGSGRLFGSGDTADPLLDEFRKTRSAIVSAWRSKRVERRVVDEEMIRRLKSLGYVE